MRSNVKGRSVTIRAGRPEDTDRLADFAESRRAQYEAYSPVFWRPAADARAKHQPFLAACLGDDQYTSRTAVSTDREVLGGAIANHRITMPPFADDPERSWFIDDFYVASPEYWDIIGRGLLESLAEAAHIAEQERLIVVTAQRDIFKRTALIRQGFESSAAWWVRPLNFSVELSDAANIPAIIAPAPPVYNPGGLIALATRMNDPAEILAFERQAVAAGAILAIVPCRNSNQTLQRGLQERGYHVASEWFTRTVLMALSKADHCRQ